MVRCGPTWSSVIIQGWHQKTVGNGTRSSSEMSYLGSEYINRENLHVLVDSHVTRILVANDSNADKKPYFNSVEFTQDAGSRLFLLFSALP